MFLKKMVVVNVKYMWFKPQINKDTNKISYARSDIILAIGQ